jgi:hypothetical protein
MVLLAVGAVVFRNSQICEVVRVPLFVINISKILTLSKARSDSIPSFRGDTPVVIITDNDL